MINLRWGREGEYDRRDSEKQESLEIQEEEVLLYMKALPYHAKGFSFNGYRMCDTLVLERGTK